MDGRGSKEEGEGMMPEARKNRRRVNITGVLPRPLGVLLLLVPLCAPSSVEAQSRDRTPRAVVTGRVLDQGNGDPIAGVDIGVEGVGPLAITDENGEFTISPFLAGSHVVWARRIGYEERSDSLAVTAGTLLHITMELSTEPIELDELVVVVRSRVLDRRGFYERERQGYGASFLNPEEIRRRNPAAVTDLLRNVPGLQVIYGGIYGAHVVVSQRVTFREGDIGCRPTIWVDGARSTMFSFDEMRVEEIEGVEVYTGATAPGKYSDICGTIAIWTKVPIR
jgi:hypothetical protein